MPVAGINSVPELMPEAGITASKEYRPLKASKALGYLSEPNNFGSSLKQGNRREAGLGQNCPGAFVGETKEFVESEWLRNRDAAAKKSRES